MAGLLNALLLNESGGRNIPNVTEGTSSGQAQGYFQITTGTWNEFGGQQYAPDPLRASYEQQAAIASKIPLKRWDESTVARMRATGLPVDPNRTLGENLAANGESIQGTPRVSGPVEAAGGGFGSDAGATLLYTPPSASATSYNRSKEPPPEAAPYEDLSDSLLADDLASSVSPSGTGRQSSEGGNSAMYGAAASSPSQDYGSQPAPEAGQAPPALLSPSSDQPLADLFKVKDIGQAALADPRTGASLLRRQRRAYG